MHFHEEVQGGSVEPPLHKMDGRESSKDQAGSLRKRKESDMEKTVRIEYLLNEDGRRQSILQGGDGKELQVVETPVTPEILKLSQVTPEGEVILRIGFAFRDGKRRPVAVAYKVAYALPFREPGWELAPVEKIVYFDTPQDVDSLVAWETKRRRKIESKDVGEEGRARIAELEARWREAQLERQQKEGEKAEEAERWRLAQEARKEREKKAEAERLAWIEEHGSDHLKRAVRLGYTCNRLYVQERAAKELPGFIVDFDDKAECEDRKCPSVEALKLVEDLIEKGYKAQVVWLKFFPPEEEGDYDPSYYEEFPCEAVVVRDFLGRYDLLKII